MGYDPIGSDSAIVLSGFGGFILLAMVAAILYLAGPAMAAAWRRRAELRVRDDEAKRLDLEIDRRAQQVPGHSPGRPITVPSPSAVEPRAARMPCIRCGGDQRVTAVEVEAMEGERLRVARVECVQCWQTDALYFRTSAPRVLH